MLKLQLFITTDINNYLLSGSCGRGLSGNASDSAKATGPPQTAPDTQTVGAAGSLG